MDSRTNIRRLPTDHQLEALVRLSTEMSAQELSEHRLHTCHGLAGDIDMLEAELEALLAMPNVAGRGFAGAIEETQAALAVLRGAIQDLASTGHSP